MVRDLARGLSRQGIETHVATTNDNGPGTLRVPCGVPVMQDDVTYWYFPRQTRFYTFSWPLGAWLARHIAEFDLVHIHALFSYATLPAAFWSSRRGVPYIVRPLGTLNDWGMKNRRPWLKRLSFRFIESRVMRNAARIHYTSDQERMEAEKQLVGAPAAVIPNALPDRLSAPPAGGFRARYPQLNGRRVVLFLSRLDAKKGLDLLLPAFARVRQQMPDTALVVAGNGNPEFVTRLKAEAACLGIEPDVIWPGFLEGDEKGAALADADVFVLPSYSENFGIAVAEAMAAGLPVVVSDHVGIHGEIARAQAGLVVSCDARSIADAIVRILGDPTLRRSLGQNAKRFADERYSSDVVTRTVLGLYNEIVQ
jgi:glycosyltransferase involved in cell wall biosynthesis